ncbi:MAG: DEAD/DEAH box helicase family protein [Candidatus Aminicenantes bacterium]|nr:DEAD/DEAH box helicase family protein [Candidatus Aminicenantes bacterium]
MPRQGRTLSNQRNRSSGIQQYVKLEHRLVLLAWINSLLGYETNRELLEDCKSAAEGFGADGNSFIYHHLIARGDKLKISKDNLARYDENIRVHLEKINRSRTEKITLRYFQYLAALYTEIMLDRLFRSKAQLIADLNAFVDDRNAHRLPSEPQDDPFVEDDLIKLAFWMATGSGKTILFHLNYYQFLYYNYDPLDNIILITPNEGMTTQHLAELASSGIPGRRFELNTSSLWSGGQNVIQVIDIHKLVEEKRGGGVSVPVEAFEGRNLIFVDEGHKGTGGEVWRKYRDALGATGFTFEYSATFGQALTAARNDPLTAEYGKAIVFDYSYKYFYLDGFGKDFRIINMPEQVDEQKTDVLLLGNLLSFYEQTRFYEEQKNNLAAYNLEKPLWIFVGSTVNAVFKENRRPCSDVLTVARFFHRVLSDQNWVIETIKNILDGNSGLKISDQDIFAGHFLFLRELNLAPGQIFEDILWRIFHVSSGSGLHLGEIKNSSGEIGLKAANAEKYFGLIYIGDSSEFKKLVEENAQEIVIEQDAIISSLFDHINESSSDINVLIGAKKFIEGWNSWRVANMGLINIGRQEGSQIIQLFGRGVRLKGKGMSLKRSAALSGSHPRHIRILETLNVFGVRAKYMGEFRNHLEKEGVETAEPLELLLPIRINNEFLDKGLVIPRPKIGLDFVSDQMFILEPDNTINIVVDMSTKIQVVESDHLEENGITKLQEARTGIEQKIPDECLDLVDWEKVYCDLIEFKNRKKLANLVVRPERLRKIIKDLNYKLIADESVVKPQKFVCVKRLQEAVTNILRKYAEAFYRIRRERWEEKEALVYYPLDTADPNLSLNRDRVGESHDGAYILRVQRSNESTESLINEVQRLLKNLDQLYTQDSQNGENVGRIYFDRHLYLPLLVKQSDIIQSIPPGLNLSEYQFVRDLKEYWENEKERLLKDKDIYLLRNLSRGRGIGFFEERGFYPDFILWILDKKAGHQRIVFAEPHGMIHAGPYDRDEKARLHEKLEDLSVVIGRRTGRNGVSLDSFIISATPFESLKKIYDDGKWDRNKFAERHILFQDAGSDYVPRILGIKK